MLTRARSRAEKAEGKHSRPSSGEQEPNKQSRQQSESTEKAVAEDNAKMDRSDKTEDWVMVGRPEVEAQVEQPSAREIAAAEAARARLYGAKNSQPAEESNIPKLPSGAEPTATVEIEYVATENLQPVDNAANSLEEGLKQASTADWVANCGGLLLLRRVIIHHKQAAWDRIEEIVNVTLKHIKSLRSSLCKTAIMCTTDIVNQFQDNIVPFLSVGGLEKPLNNLLAQLLLKGSSNDKRFVIEEAKLALQAIAESISPLCLLPSILPQAQHKSPKVRGIAAVVLANSLTRLPQSEWPRKEVDDILKVVAKLVSDNTPDARNAAKRIIPMLHAAYDYQAEEKENGHGQENVQSVEASTTESSQGMKSWDAHCKLCLGSSANAVLKAT